MVNSAINFKKTRKLTELIKGNLSFFSDDMDPLKYTRLGQKREETGSFPDILWIWTTGAFSLNLAEWLSDSKQSLRLDRVLLLSFSPTLLSFEIGTIVQVELVLWINLFLSLVSLSLDEESGISSFNSSISNLHFTLLTWWTFYYSLTMLIFCWQWVQLGKVEGLVSKWS